MDVTASSLQSEFRCQPQNLYPPFTPSGRFSNPLCFIYVEGSCDMLLPEYSASFSSLKESLYSHLTKNFTIPVSFLLMEEKDVVHSWSLNAPPKIASGSDVSTGGYWLKSKV